jgi:ribonuclease HI
MSIEAFVDGSAHPNPGPGGFGVIVLDKDKNFGYNNYKVVEVYTKQTNQTSNNKEELKSILYVFLNYGININNGEFAEIPIVYSDSAYAVNTFNDWMFSWSRNNWRKSDKKVPENLELIQAYYDWYQKGYRIDLRKVKGHKGNFGNEMADLLATGKASVEEVKQMIDSFTSEVKGNFN